jgi:hypothetical protein
MTITKTTPEVKMPVTARRFGYAVAVGINVVMLSAVPRGSFDLGRGGIRTVR